MLSLKKSVAILRRFFRRILRKVRRKMVERGMKEVFIDAEYNWLKAVPTSQVKLREFTDYQLEKCKASINEEKMNRYLKDLSSPLLDPKEAGPFLKLYFEARDLYREGYFYSCIAMCRITAEKICEALIYIANISAEDKKRLLETRLYDLIWILLKLKIADSVVFDNLEQIRKIGNSYIHTDAQLNPNLDSEKAIITLGKLVDSTSSIFNNYDLVDGKLVSKVKK